MSPKSIAPLTALLMTALAASSHAVNKQPVWPEGPPSENGLSGPELEERCIGNISVARYLMFPAPDTGKPAPAVIVAPGGGYARVCHEGEGLNLVDYLNDMGFTAVVLYYRMPNGHHEVPSDDAFRMIRLLRHNAEAWNINPDRIGFWGYSAGGHLAASVATLHSPGDPGADDPVARHSSRPDFSILFYPVISMREGITHGGSRENLLGPDPTPELVDRYSLDEQVAADTPPTFLFHCADDRAVPVANSLRYYARLAGFDSPSELHIVEDGGHGGDAALMHEPEWKPALARWLERRVAGD